MDKESSVRITREEILALGRETIRTEGEAILALQRYLGEDFHQAVLTLLHMEGRAIITGIGKSAIIAQKIVATLNSTGTPSVFMHAADAIHGDLGIVQPGDVLICLSKSGTTPEIKVLVPLLKMMGNPLIAIVSNTDSYLAQQAKLVLPATVEHEACPNNLAPTTSTSAQLVIGDALAVTLLKARGFTPSDFARYHPGGALGKRLYLRVDDILDHETLPAVGPDDNLSRLIVEISSKLLGATAVLGPAGELLGIVTDGDLRRMLQRKLDIETTLARDIMSTQPHTIASDELAINAFNRMERHKITQLIVLNQGRYAGMLHLHDLLREGIIG
ncbi:MAG: D-arabinose 5-phosphate isomerase [Bacteroidia bacterium]|nr:MAG: D-arabinose 5-phosphate isomerase [Bacteroidia bacterium]